MHVLVTGGAGFIGSHLVERLLAAGETVSAVDDFDPYYGRARKEANLAAVRSNPRLRFLETDLARDDLAEAVDGVDAVVHLAAIPGVRGSWGDSFEPYLRNNVLATQRLLEALGPRPEALFVYGGSASVYGDAAVEAVDETWLPAPHSPYGVTKLAGEHLAHLYRLVHGRPSLAVRIFSCYGPRERPDKAIQKFLTAAREGRGIEVYGDGSQRRDFTYVGDIVGGLCAALERAPLGETINLARGRTETLREVVETIQDLTGGELQVTYTPREAGDVRVTHACIDKARALLGYDPQVDLRQGIEAQWKQVQAEATA
jgi:nucleoside-diphosphate-sugar epimerase